MTFLSLFAFFDGEDVVLNLFKKSSLGLSQRVDKCVLGAATKELENELFP